MATRHDFRNTLRTFSIDELKMKQEQILNLYSMILYRLRQIETENFSLEIVYIQNPLTVCASAPKMLNITQERETYEKHAKTLLNALEEVRQEIDSRYYKF